MHPCKLNDRKKVYLVVALAAIIIREKLIINASREGTERQSQETTEREDREVTIVPCTSQWPRDERKGEAHLALAGDPPLVRCKATQRQCQR